MLNLKAVNVARVQLLAPKRYFADRNSSKESILHINEVGRSFSRALPVHPWKRRCSRCTRSFRVRVDNSPAAVNISLERSTSFLRVLDHFPPRGLGGCCVLNVCHRVRSAVCCVFCSNLFFVATGLSASPPNGTVSPARRASRLSRGSHVSYGRQSSGGPHEGAEPASAITARDSRTDGLYMGSGGTGTGGEISCFSGLKYIGRLTDGSGDEMVETYLGSFHQQALISEAKRVLSQPQNKGLGMELVAGVAAVGVGRNSIGATITSSRPYKKVRPLHMPVFTWDEAYCKVVRKSRNA